MDQGGPFAILLVLILDMQCTHVLYVGGVIIVNFIRILYLSNNAGGSGAASCVITSFLKFFSRFFTNIDSKFFLNFKCNNNEKQILQQINWLFRNKNYVNVPTCNRPPITKDISFVSCLKTIHQSLVSQFDLGFEYIYFHQNHPHHHPRFHFRNLP